MVRFENVFINQYNTKQDVTVKHRIKFLCIAVRSALFGQFRSWLGEVLGVELEPTVDVSCARYEYTGKLAAKTQQEGPIYF